MNTILMIAAACFCAAAVLAIAVVFSVCRKLKLLVSNQLKLVSNQLERAQWETGRRLEAVERKLDESNRRLDAVESLISDFGGKLDGISTAVIPDDSAARRAKTEVDKFNEGLFNILTYNGSRKPEDK